MNRPSAGIVRARLAGHLRSNPRWVVVLAAWAVALAALPVIDGTTAGPRDSGTASARPSHEDMVPPAVSSVPPSDLEQRFEDLEQRYVDLMDAADPVPPTTALPADTTTSTALELVGSDPVDLLFDLLPPLPGLPGLPPELDGLAQAVAPIISRGCSALGLASVVIAVAAPTVQEIPLQRLLPYLGLVTAACALIPIPPTHTVCGADRPLIQDIAGITSTPPIIGLGIDQIAAMEQLVRRDLGVPLPEIAPTLRVQLDCEIIQG